MSHDDEIQWCTERQAKLHGEFIVSRDTMDEALKVYRRLKKKLTRGTIKWNWNPHIGYSLYYFDEPRKRNDRQ